MTMIEKLMKIAKTINVAEVDAPVGVMVTTSGKLRLLFSISSGMIYSTEEQVNAAIDAYIVQMDRGEGRVTATLPQGG